MKTTATDITFSQTLDGKLQVTATLDATPQDAQAWIDELTGDKFNIEIKKYRRKRSLNANSLLWLILSEMAVKLRTSKEELYIEMLARYGVFTHIVVKPEAVDRVKEQWREVRELGPVVIGGQKGIQLQCYFGSSTYDTKEMSVLLDGVVSEAREIGIAVMSESERALLLSEWGE